MSQETTSWVSHGNGTRFALQQVKLGPLKADEVRVKLKATGICHTGLLLKLVLRINTYLVVDILAADGDLPAQLPAILGHEGAGEIVEVGPGVSNLQEGDRVVLSFASCSSCHSCLSGVPTACSEFLALNLMGTRTENVHTIPSTSAEDQQGNDTISLTTKFFGQSTFATFANVNVRSCVKLNPESLKLASGDDVPWARLASLGCGFMTGSGTVLNVCKPGPGSSIGVFGVGAVGLAAIAAARNLSAASSIIAVDISQPKLDVAASMGATLCFNSRQGNDACIQAIKDATGGRGLDFAIDTTGNVNVIGTMLRCLTAYGSSFSQDDDPYANFRRYWDTDSRSIVRQKCRGSSVIHGQRCSYLPRHHNGCCKSTISMCQVQSLEDHHSRHGER